MATAARLVPDEERRDGARAEAAAIYQGFADNDEASSSVRAEALGPLADLAALSGACAAAERWLTTGVTLPLEDDTLRSLEGTLLPVTHSRPPP